VLSCKGNGTVITTQKKGGTCRIDLTHSVCRFWIEHDVPRQIKIKGAVLQDQFREDGVIRSEIFCAMVRHLQNLDASMYRNSGCDHKQWRHLMEPTFSVSYSGNLQMTAVINLS